MFSVLSSSFHYTSATAARKLYIILFSLMLLAISGAFSHPCYTLLLSYLSTFFLALILQLESAPKKLKI